MVLETETGDRQTVHSSVPIKENTIANPGQDKYLIQLARIQNIGKSSFEEVGPKAGKSIITKIVGWINSAKPVSGQTEYGKHGYPMVISIKMDDGKMISIEPAYDCVSKTNADGSGSKTCTPIKDEIVYSNNSNKIRAESPELYEWLKEGWKQEK